MVPSTCGVTYWLILGYFVSVPAPALQTIAHMFPSTRTQSHCTTSFSSRCLVVWLRHGRDPLFNATTLVSAWACQKTYYGLVQCIFYKLLIYGMTAIVPRSISRSSSLLLQHHIRSITADTISLPEYYQGTVAYTPGQGRRLPSPTARRQALQPQKGKLSPGSLARLVEILEMETRQASANCETRSICHVIGPTTREVGACHRALPNSPCWIACGSRQASHSELERPSSIYCTCSLAPCTVFVVELELLQYCFMISTTYTINTATNKANLLPYDSVGIECPTSKPLA